MGATKKDLQTWIEQMLDKRGVDKYTLDFSGSSAKGDGYLGEINFVKVVCDSGEGEEKVYDLVIKSAKTNDDLRKNTPIVETYEREIQAYTEVFPAIDNFQKENAIENQFIHYPKCFSVCTLNKQEALLLSNLKSSGYVVHDRMVPQNLEHAAFVFRTYALWHGSSLALKIKNPELFKKITNGMTDVMGDFLKMTDMLPLFEKYFEKSLNILKSRGKEAAAKKIQKDVGDIEVALTKMTLIDDKDADKEAVILHGDCWNNNMMFKYKDSDTSKPIDMAFIDFQCTRVASPILDLSYYLYSISDKPTLDKFDYLLDEYHKTLSHYLKQYGIDIEDILTRKRLKDSWKKYGRFGLLMAPFIIKIELSHEEEVIDLVGKAADNTLGDIPIDDIIKHQGEYDRRIFDVYNHFAEQYL